MTGPLEAASGVVDSLKSSPMVLGLVVINLLLLGYMFYEAKATSDARLATVKEILDFQKESQKLLMNCMEGARAPKTDLWQTIPLPRLSELPLK